MLFRSGLEAYLNSTENDWDRVKDVAKMENPPKFYFCCGTEDGLYPRYLAFKEYAQEVGLKAVFDEREGYAHEWRFWELEIQEILKFFGFKKGFKDRVMSSTNRDATLL